ncbi:hypothetical protein [Culturomica massiliensis]|jgi:hypothetical protein|uniref:hypothetical protein n=1 Tax=Culturomica massiliensis TaxID=1841857 RepID=UPI000E560B76|nr:MULTISPECIES: hypothetical protein [Odoribacteraceae]RHV92972.1 hypothetical protein DXA95_11460 [Odoribacter sp. OF09-27XD]
MDKHLTWRIIKAFYELYHTGRTKARIVAHVYVKHLLQSRYLEYKRGVKDVLLASSRFRLLYEKEQWEMLYQKYVTFLEQYDLLSPYKDFTEFDLKHLMSMAQSAQVLEEFRENIRIGHENRQGVSNFFFKATKHIEKGTVLEDAVLRILGIDHFPDSEQQGFYRVPCVSPRCIILCENGYFLTLDIAREREVELWYVGGNNTRPLEHLDKIDYPIYYLCDWDQHGLEIYERLYQIIEGVEHRCSSLTLLTPNGKREKLKDTEDHHSSVWKPGPCFSGLTPERYSPAQQVLLADLIAREEWIEEEGNDLVGLIEGMNFR